LACLYCKGNLKLGVGCGNWWGNPKYKYIGTKYRSGNTTHLAGESEEKKG
jgi:hypothetical protein